MTTIYAIEELVLEKLRNLPRNRKQEVLNFIEFLEYKGASSQKKQQLAAAAEALLSDYTMNDELTAFTALDSEEFYA